ncbi:MAG: hypothetical protein DMF91_26960 [Acidobacteria bacterium]|nr:MAG: hypothetical protein DMF91_26960 [Acidobacteriota bacterium]
MFSSKSTHGVCWMPRRAHEPLVIQSSKLNCANAYLIRNSRLPASELPVPASRDTSGVMRNAIRCEILPVMLR